MIKTYSFLENASASPLLCSLVCHWDHFLILFKLNFEPSAQWRKNLRNLTLSADSD
jgi:hypothetical protein